MPGAGVTPEGDRRCCREETDTAAPNLPGTGGLGALPRIAYTKGLQNCGVTSNSAIHAQGPIGATSAASVTLQPKRWCLPHTPGCWSSLPCGVSPQRPCCSVVPMAALRPSLAPQQSPSVRSYASCPAPHWGCGGVGAPFGNHSNTGFHPPTKQEELTTLAAQGHLCKYLSSLLYLGSVQKHDKAGKGSRHSHSGGRT